MSTKKIVDIQSPIKEKRFMSNDSPLIFGQRNSDHDCSYSRWRIGYMHDPGARTEQQDALGCVAGLYRGRPLILAVLADGMGGMKNGSYFSQTIVSYHCDHFQETLNTVATVPGVLLSLALRANAEATKAYNVDEPGGTTLVSALFIADSFYTLSVGDSRITLYRKNTQNRYVPLQISREHVLGAALDERAWMGVISREDAEGNIYRNSLTSSLGPPKVKRVDLMDCAVHFMKGDQLVLMSDGVYKTVPDLELAAFLESEPETAARRILEEVKKRGKKDQDNMSALIIQKEREGGETNV